MKMMIKRNRWRILISSLIILLPAFVRIMSENAFMPAAGPIFILVIHWICILATAADPGNRDQSKKIMGMMLWICPVVSLFAGGISYAAEKRIDLGLEMAAPVILGVSFMLIGNYLPKCRRNNTIGIRLPWTLGSDENWNKTHRLAGKLWLAGGLVIMLSGFLPNAFRSVVFGAVFLIMLLLPAGYSREYYRRQKSEGALAADTASSDPGQNAHLKKFSMVFTAAAIIFAAILLSTGNIEVSCGEDSFTIAAAYWQDLTVSYDDIESMQYRDEVTAGSRVGGFGSPRLLMGNFKNDEFGYYTRYSYAGCDAGIVMTVDGNVLVVSAADEAATKALYKELLTKTESHL